MFTEEMFDEGQHLPSPYHATKFEAERLVREQDEVPWRVNMLGDRFPERLLIAIEEGAG